MNDTEKQEAMNDNQKARGDEHYTRSSDENKTEKEEDAYKKRVASTTLTRLLLTYVLSFLLAKAAMKAELST